MSEKATDRRVAARVEEVLNGWWRRQGEKFRRCKTLDVGQRGALVVLDSVLDDSAEFELHLDMDAEWSVALNAQVLWQRPIFFGKQQLTAVNYRFQDSKDESMFGLWVQRRLKEDVKRGLEEHLAPVVLSQPKSRPEPVLEPAPKVQVIDAPWKRVFSQLTAKIPWFDADPLPNERRRECRGQVGLAVVVETDDGKDAAEFLNVSLSGACLFLPTPDQSTGLFGKLKLEKGQRIELSVSSKSLLMGGSRCKAEVVWCQKAEGPENTRGVVAGIKFTSQPQATRMTFVGDLLKRINYNLRQARSELRFPRTQPVTVELSSGETVTGVTADVSAGGACLILPEKLAVPCNATVRLTLDAKEDKHVLLSSRLLRHTVDKDGRNCYAVAFRKQQPKERIELSRWLASQLRMQELDELIPDSSLTEPGVSE